MRLVCSLLVSAFVISCGGDPRYRPLELEVQGLSGRAVRLVVLLYPESSVPPECSPALVESIQTLDAPFRRVWERSSNADRALAFPEIVDERVTIIAYSENDQGMPIQLGCATVAYTDIECPELTLTLGRDPSEGSTLGRACT